MGISDLIPGISGGTIAFITGIYERLIRALRGLSFTSIFLLFKSTIMLDFKKLSSHIKHLDLIFLTLVFSGLFSALLLGSSLILFLLNTYESLILVFFIGLIMGSSLVIYEHITDHSNVNRYFSLLGLSLAFSIFLVSPQDIYVTYFYLFLGGLISVSALFLPGISGAFILLIMGLYEKLLFSLSNIRSEYMSLLFFGSGAIVGVYMISRAITYLFDLDKPKTLYVLLGLVIGTLVFPVSIVLQNFTGSISEILSYIVLLLFGFILSLIFKKS